MTRVVMSSEAHRSDSSQIDSYLSIEAEDDIGNSGSTKSLSEHAACNVIENGRQYCNDTYCMPNDEAEQTRLSILHQLFLILLDGHLTQTPLPDSISHILDLGSGPGDWAIAIGEEHPEVEVIATDISVFDTQSISIAPPNVYFQIDDFEEKWTFREHFDFIHVRGLSRAVADWHYLYEQAFEHLTPGGAIQVTDINLCSGDLRPDSYINIYISAVASAAELDGKNPIFEHLRPGVLAAAGFKDIRTYDFDVPIGPWPASPRAMTMGKMALIVLLEGLEAESMRLLTRYMGWNAEDVIDLCEKVKLEIVNGERVVGKAKIVVARRPVAAH
ncbi:hypothetical protein LOZ58_000820 [Ophidiomyces ophidiicola]|nr:hypothetical protein LOZ65_000715 [Ophidiomyces ophidiicola]KAI1943926.1 hypothetical protein LOZ66_000513 [Ophidiomyces ophidiicola]KAI1965920.1 hypothetical protein LOZ58_000820 [Ophidiomyces ophidiicola]